MRGFTLLELLIVITILAILALAIILVLDPAETMKKSRDVQRISDMSTLKAAVVLYIGERGDGAGVGEGVCETDNPCVSVMETGGLPNGHNPTQLGHHPKELKYGWVPIDFTLMSSSPITSLLIDPINSQTYYYRYATDGRDFIFDCKLESKYYSETIVLQEADGGACNTSYEVGSKMDLFSDNCR